MNFIMSVIIVSLLVGVPLLKFIEKETIKRNTGEKILIEIKEKTNIRKLILYFLFAIILLFVIRTEEVTLYLAISKILFIVALYFAEEQLKTRIYLTNQSVYMVTRFRKKQLTRLQRFRRSQLYRIDMIPNQPGIYRLYFNGQNNYLNTLDVTIYKKDDLQLFRALVKKNLDIYINEPVDIQTPHQHTREEIMAMDTLTKYFLLAVGILSAFALLKTTLFLDGPAVFSEVLTAVIAIQFVPFLLYLMTYVFIQTAQLTDRFQLVKKSVKELSFLYLIGSAVLPFIILLNHGMAEGTRYLIVHLIGVFLFTFTLILAWCIGKITKYAREKQVLKILEQLLMKIPRKQKKSA